MINTSYSQHWFWSKSWWSINCHRVTSQVICAECPSNASERCRQLHCRSHAQVVEFCSHFSRVMGRPDLRRFLVTFYSREVRVPLKIFRPAHCFIVIWLLKLFSAQAWCHKNLCTDVDTLWNLAHWHVNIPAGFYWADTRQSQASVHLQLIKSGNFLIVSRMLSAHYKQNNNIMYDLIKLHILVNLLKWNELCLIYV